MGRFSIGTNPHTWIDSLGRNLNIRAKPLTRCTFCLFRTDVFFESQYTRSFQYRYSVKSIK